MKWFFLFIIISCGRNEVPKAVDNFDSDGDQISNYLESGDEKYYADFKPIGELNGEMTFSVSGIILKEKVLKFTNKRDLLAETMNVMTLNKSLIKDQNLSFEWSPLVIEKDPQPESLADRMYNVRLKFAATEEAPQTLAIIKEGVLKNLGAWKSEMSFSLTSQEMDSLLKKESILTVGKKMNRQTYMDSQTVGSTVQEKTYRVFFYDGQQVRVINVAKELDFQQFKKNMSIETASDIDEAKFFFAENSEVSSWWERFLPNGDKVLMKTTLQFLRESLLKNFMKGSGQLNRENGYHQNSIVLNKKSAAKIYLNLRTSQVMRGFLESSEISRHMIGGGREGSSDKWTCTHYYRSIQSENPVNIELIDALKNLKVKTKTQILEATDLISELTVKNDQNGTYYQMVLSIEEQDMELFLTDRPSNTFVSTGTYNLVCPPGYPVRGNISVVATNTEAKLSLSIEAFVEKLE